MSIKNSFQVWTPLIVASAVALSCMYFYEKMGTMDLGMFASVVALGFAFLFTFFFVFTSKRFYKVSSHQAIACALGCAAGFMLAGFVINNFSILHLLFGVVSLVVTIPIAMIVVEDHDRITSYLRELLTPLGLVVGVFSMLLGKHEDWSIGWHLALTLGIPALFICSHTGMNTMWFEEEPGCKQNTLAQ